MLQSLFGGFSCLSVCLSVCRSVCRLLNIISNSSEAWTKITDTWDKSLRLFILPFFHFWERTHLPFRDRAWVCFAPFAEFLIKEIIFFSIKETANCSVQWNKMVFLILQTTMIGVDTKAADVILGGREVLVQWKWLWKVKQNVFQWFHTYPISKYQLHSRKRPLARCSARSSEARLPRT